MQQIKPYANPSSHYPIKYHDGFFYRYFYMYQVGCEKFAISIHRSYSNKVKEKSHNFNKSRLCLMNGTGAVRVCVCVSVPNCWNDKNQQIIIRKNSSTLHNDGSAKWPKYKSHTTKEKHALEFVNFDLDSRQMCR